MRSGVKNYVEFYAFSLLPPTSVCHYNRQLLYEVSNGKMREGHISIKSTRIGVQLKLLLGLF
jgi:hypothetical protein